jgi:hypothetical protein
VFQKLNVELFTVINDKLITLIVSDFHPFSVVESVVIRKASTAFERATKESRNMSAATKGRGDKKARRQKSVATKQREVNKHCDKTAFQKVLGPYR